MIVTVLLLYVVSSLTATSRTPPPTSATDVRSEPGVAGNPAQTGAGSVAVLLASARLLACSQS